MANGVEQEQITLISSEIEAVDRALNICQKGDLLLIFADKITRSWKQIIYFHDVQQKQASATIEVPEVEAMSPSIEDLFGEQFSQDTRGVFLPVEQSD